MSEENESPVEQLTEEIHHAAHHAKEAWLKWSALLSALFAVLAAISSLQSSHYSDSAMIHQIEASDRWGYYQAKGIKAMVVQSQIHLLQALGKSDPALEKQYDKYQDDQDEIQSSAEKALEMSKAHLEIHEIFSRAVTLFQVSIAVIAITVLTKRRHFLILAAMLGLAAGLFLIYGLWCAR